jgi:phytoene dehydrogenase-like protein
LDRYDSIIIGAGHNGLVCAAYLAKNGQKVLLLESSDSAGGLASEREFCPGFKSSVAHSASHFPDKIVNELKLESFGLSPASSPILTTGLGPDGQHVSVQGKHIDGTSKKDTAAFQKYIHLMQRFANALKPFWLKTIPRIGLGSLSDLMTFGHMGLKLRSLGKKDMGEFLRIAALPCRDLMDENFDNDLLKTILSWDGLIGSKLAPRSPNHSGLALLYRMAGRNRGSVRALVTALETAAKTNGAEIRTSAAVKRILVHGSENGLLAKGVLLEDGSQIEADNIISAADPQTTFLKLVGVENLEIEFTNRIRRLRCEGYVAKLHLALKGLPNFTGLEQPQGRMIIAPDLDSIEFAFDDAKYGQCSGQAVMEMLIPSLEDSSLAPEGQHVLSAHVMYVPYQLRDGWDQAKRDQLCEKLIDTIEQYAPGIREQIIASELLTPQDLEELFGVTGGHWHHTELALDQALMIRPTYGAAQYKTPIPGLYICGAGCHPGGDLTGGPGHNAAQEILG